MRRNSRKPRKLGPPPPGMGAEYWIKMKKISEDNHARFATLPEPIRRRLANGHWGAPPDLMTRLLEAHLQGASIGSLLSHIANTEARVTNAYWALIESISGTLFKKGTSDNNLVSRRHFGVL